MGLSDRCGPAIWSAVFAFLVLWSGSGSGHRLGWVAGASEIGSEGGREGGRVLTGLWLC